MVTVFDCFSSSVELFGCYWGGFQAVLSKKTSFKAVNITLGKNLVTEKALCKTWCTCVISLHFTNQST